MKHLQTTLLTAIIFAFGSLSANASFVDVDAILAAVDGEAEVTDTQVMDAKRVNFDISADDMSAADFWAPENAGILDDTYY